MMVERRKKMDNCKKCDHPISWHHGKQKQKTVDGVEYLRTCYGIGCVCGEP